MSFNREVFVIEISLVGYAYWDVFFSKNVCDPVIESLRNVRDLEVWPFCVGRLRVSLRVLWSYLKIPYISERLNHKITNIFRKENIPVCIAQKFYTLRQALSHISSERKCTRDKCPISYTGLCLRRNAVYQLTCNSCDQQYIGSTTRPIHDRVREHLNNENSSVKKSYLLLPEQRL